MKKIWFICFLALLLIVPFAKVQASQTNPASFLEIGAGARAIAVGGAFVGLADDVSATYWNPAGLAQLTSPEISIMDRLTLIDTNYANATAAVPIGEWGILGFNFTYYGVDNIIHYDDEGEEKGTLTNTEAAMTMSYAYGLGNLLVEANLKYIYKGLDLRDTRSGIGLDVALLYKLTEHFSVGTILPITLP